MKKRILFATLFLAVGCFAMAQEISPDTLDTHFVYIKGQSLWEVIKLNWWALAALFYTIVEYYLGKSGKIKEGSVWHWLINLIGRQIFKKAELIKTKETNRAVYLANKARKDFIRRQKSAPITKILIVAVILAGLSLSLSAQKAHPYRWYPFAKSIPSVMANNLPMYSKDSTLYFAPAVGFDVYTRGTTTGKHSVGAIPGIGYNLIYNPFLWQKNYLAGIGLFASAQQDFENPDIFTFEITPVITILNWVKLGYGHQWNFGGQNEWVLRIGIVKQL